MVRGMEPFIWHIGGAGWGRMWGEGAGRRRGVKNLKIDWLVLSLLALLPRKLLNHCSYGEVLHPITSKTLKLVSIPMVFTIKRGWQNQKVWMITEILISVLAKISHKMEATKRKIRLFMDNVPCCPEILIKWSLF